jgi:hypothetical protein
MARQSACPVIPGPCEEVIIAEEASSGEARERAGFPRRGWRQPLQEAAYHSASGAPVARPTCPPHTPPTSAIERDIGLRAAALAPTPPGQPPEPGRRHRSHSCPSQTKPPASYPWPHVLPQLPEAPPKPEKTFSRASSRGLCQNSRRCWRLWRGWRRGFYLGYGSPSSD